MLKKYIYSSSYRQVLPYYLHLNYTKPNVSRASYGSSYINFHQQLQFHFEKKKKESFHLNNKQKADEEQNDKETGKRRNAIFKIKIFQSKTCSKTTARWHTHIYYMGLNADMKFES